MKRCKGFAAWLLLTLLFAPTAFSQYSIEVQKVETNAFPDVTANVVVRQNGVIVRSTDSTNFTLKEDGFVQSPLHLTHPQATQPYSLTIIIGVGSTMTAADIAFAKGLAGRLVDRMNGVIDESAIVTYDGNYFVQQDITHIKPLLTNAINSIVPTGGSNYLWDGAFNGVKYCLSNSTHPSRAVVLLSNGKADGGTLDVQSVINIAISGNVRVHCFGINAVGSDTELRRLSQETKGTYYTNSDLLVQEVIDALNGTAAASQLVYRSNNVCRDGEDRSLDVKVKIANDSAEVQQPFVLDADPSGDVTVTMVTDTASIVSLTTKDVALQISPAIQDQRLYAGTISLSFDTTKLKLTGAVTTGHLAEGMNASVAMNGTGAVVTLGGSARLSGAGTLMMLSFKAGSVQANTDVQVQVADVSLSRGCLTVQRGSARITVRPQSGSMSTQALPLVFRWNATTKHYDPDPGIVTIEVENDGDLPLTGIEATLDQSDDVRVAYGGSRVAMLTPSSLLPGETGTVTWYVQVQPQATEKTAQVDVHFTSAEGTAAQQRLYMNIKPATSAVAMRCDADVITVQAGSYTPDPAEVRAEITSAGTNDSPAGDVTIILPQDVTLDGGSATQSFTALASGSSNTLTWPLRYPRPSVATDYPLTFVRTAAGYPNDTARIMLTVPVLTAAQLDVTCDISPTEIDSSVTEVTYSVTVRNIGSADAANVAAGLIVPVSFTLAAGEDATKAVADPLAPGTSGTVSWKLIPVLPFPCADATSDITTLVQSASVLPVQCSAQILRKAGGNLLPEILSASPATPMTVHTDTNITFDVEMYDFERQALTYEWFIDGISVTNATRNFTHSFATEASYLVRVDVYDPCSKGVGPAVSYTWQVTVDNTTAVENPSAVSSYAIVANYPNPFNPATVIEYRLPEGRHSVRLEVFDATGRLVRSLLEGEQDGGTHRVTFDAAGLPSGSYLARLSADGVVRTHWMMLLK